MELPKPLSKEAVAVLADVCVLIDDDVDFRVGDGQMVVHPLRVLGPIVGRLSDGTEDDTPVAVLGDVFVSIFEIRTDEEPNSSIIPTDKCQDRWFVFLEGSSPFFESPRSRGLDSSSVRPFSPTAG